MPCPPHRPWLDHSNYTWRRVQVMKLLIMQYLLDLNGDKSVLLYRIPTVCFLPFAVHFTKLTVTHDYATSPI
jgi:hypothetical protein